MIATPRLVLRPWREDDKPAFAEIINTPAMMEHFGGMTVREALDALIDMQVAKQARDGHCMWAVEDRGDGALIGICGVRIADHYIDLPISGDLEIGWRVAEPFWGKGIAREAAQASIAWGWANTAAPRIAAWTTIENTRSWGLMERLGMKRRVDLDFVHPRFEPDDPFGAMIVYAIDRPA
ncbi:GNAT family N-acetyltransferase [uncultured Sphingomonas sp.]|uniref:GNAT family N-acetyltransferase n=1 Tax=uncultured Sphingomonas sp. TaxID=158754 RepID=UPI0035CBB1DD